MCDIRLVVATRDAPEAFSRTTLLGQSVGRLAFAAHIELALTHSNRIALSVVYNREIIHKHRHKILVFLHDDVWIDDYYFVERIRESLRAFDVVGLAGNTRGGREQCAWPFRERVRDWDDGNLRGAVAHVGRGLSWYGPTPCGVVLLDGMLIAARCSTLLDVGVRFDPQFAFHFYDMDYCRSAVKAGLRLGTWPIALTHASGGRFGSPEWQAAAAAYFRKWPKS
jgi:hypothetical protein